MADAAQWEASRHADNEVLEKNQGIPCSPPGPEQYEHRSAGPWCCPVRTCALPAGLPAQLLSQPVLAQTLL